MIREADLLQLVLAASALRAGLLAFARPRFAPSASPHGALAACEEELFTLRRASSALWAFVLLDSLLRTYVAYWALRPPVSWGLLAWTAGSDVVLAFAAAGLRRPGRCLAAPLLHPLRLLAAALSGGSAFHDDGRSLLLPRGGPLPSVLPAPLADNGTCAAWLSELTGAAPSDVLRGLRDEELWPGSRVREALARLGVRPHERSAELERYCAETGDFLYELVLWNRCRFKLGMRARIMAALGTAGPKPLRVLCFGDGLGADAACLSALGHAVEHWEPAPACRAFARRLFAAEGRAVRVLEREPAETGAYDAVVCLDVLEHVPDPPALAARLSALLRPGGRLFVHAPFGILTPEAGTHLRSNRVYFGRPERVFPPELRLAGGEPLFWAPVVFEKSPGAAALPPAFRASALLMRCGVYAFAWRMLVEVPVRWANLISLSALRRTFFEASRLAPFCSSDGEVRP
ncbi:MAG: methyltransferase domain-containing protein [Elusimicrobiota bacterium]|jgi:SAM-dependent methyltransferase